MHTMRLDSANIYASGILFNDDEVVVSKQKISIYDPNRNLLGTTKTNEDGSFNIRLAIDSSIDTTQTIDLLFRLVQEKKVASLNPEIKKDQFLAKLLSYFKSRTETQEVIVKDVRLDSDSLYLGDVIMNPAFKSEEVPYSYYTDLAFTAIPAVLKNLKEKTEFYLENYTSEEGLERIQEDHNVNAVPITAENSWKFVTDGMCPIDFIDIGDHLVAPFNYDAYDFDKLRSLPNIKGYFKKIEDKTPLLDKIEVTYRKTLHASSTASDFEPTVTYLASENNFEEGLRLFNSDAHLEGQLKSHLSLHAWSARIAQIAEDHLYGTTIGSFLLEHCRYTRKISHELGDPEIFGPGSVLDETALNPRGIGRCIDDTSQGFDPFNYKYIKKQVRGHHFAINDTIYYDAMLKASTNFVNHQWNHIVAEWGITYPFFKKLSKISPVYADFAKDPDGPTEADKKMLAQFLAYYIHLVSFRHSHIHKMQYAETPIAPNILDQNAFPLAPEEYGKGRFANMKVEAAEHVAEITDTFRYFPIKNYLLLHNPRVSPYIKHEIEIIKGKLLRHGFDADSELTVGIVI